MKSRFLVLGLSLLLLSWVGAASAQVCPAGSVRQTSGTPGNPGSNAGNFTQFISGNTICASRGTDRWQEQHRAGSQLWDYKLGPSSTMDPSKQVGTWSSQNGADATVTHTYAAAGSYVWAVCRVTTAGEASSYTLVSTSGNGGAPITGVRILTGQVPCP